MSPPSSQPPGWYYAQGDPPGTHRWWDGTQWVGGPVASGASAYSPPAGPYGYGASYPFATPPMALAKYAGWWRRVGANLLDSLIIGVPSGIVNAIVQAAAPSRTTLCRDIDGDLYRCEVPTGAGWAMIIVAALVVFALTIAYYVYLVGKTGQTVGKQACNIWVIDERTGQPGIGYGRATGRYFGSILSALPCMLGFLWPIWDAKKQTFHDKLVHSVVVHR